MARMLSLTVVVWISLATAGTARGAQASATGPGDEQGQIKKGGQVVGQVCATCHAATLSRMLQVHRQTREQWRDTVNFMISRGAQVMPDEIEPVIAFLAATAGPQTQRPGRPAAERASEPSPAPITAPQAPQPQTNQGSSPWMYYPRDVAVGDGGPAPKRDLSGTWAGPGSTDAIPRGAAPERPSLTPLAQQIMNQRKPIGRYGPAGTNDPTARYCDPLGFPLNAVYQSRAMSVATMPNRIVFMPQYGGYWREVWTDGRALPAKVGGPDKDSLDPTYMGYTVGRWEDDYNFVVETTGLDERTWVMRDGTPHSVMARVQERYTRIDHNTMKVSLTIDDPKMFTKPFSLGTYYYRWIPNQKINEWLCVPSEMLKYLEQQGNPAGSYPEEQPQRLGGRGR